MASTARSISSPQTTSGPASPLVRGRSVGHLTGDFCTRDIQLKNVILEAVIERGDSVRVERVGLDDVGARFEILPLNGLDDMRLRNIQHVEVPPQIARVVQESGAAKRRFVKLLRLEHRSHGAVQNDDPLPKEILERRNSCFS